MSAENKQQIPRLRETRWYINHPTKLPMNFDDLNSLGNIDMHSELLHNVCIPYTVLKDSEFFEDQEKGNKQEMIERLAGKWFYIISELGDPWERKQKLMESLEFDSRYDDLADDDHKKKAIKEQEYVWVRIQAAPELPEKKIIEANGHPVWTLRCFRWYDPDLKKVTHQPMTFDYAFFEEDTINTWKWIPNDIFDDKHNASTDLEPSWDLLGKELSKQYRSKYIELMMQMKRMGDVMQGGCFNARNTDPDKSAKKKKNTDV